MKLLRVALAACAVSAAFAAWASWGDGWSAPGLSSWTHDFQVKSLDTREQALWPGMQAAGVGQRGSTGLPRAFPSPSPLPRLPTRAAAFQAASSTLGFTASELFQMPSSWLSAAAVEVGDVTGDGRLDVVVLARPISNAPTTVKTRIFVFPQNAQGGFDARLEIVSSDSYAQMKLGDLDGDGDSDIVVSMTGGLISYMHRPDGTFQFTYSVGYAADALGLLDVDLDGRLDAVTRTVYHRASIRYGDGAGSFPTVAAALVISSGHQFAVGDVTSDGLPDIVAPDSGVYVTEVVPHDQLQGGEPTAYSYGPSFYGTPPVALGDFNANGRNDVALAIAGDPGPYIELRHQDAAGTLGPASALSVPDRGIALASGDMDSDGRDDLVMLYGLAPMKLGVLLQTATGFAPMYSLDGIGFSAIGPAALALGDVNGDGCLDAIALSSDKVVLFAATCRRPRTAMVCRTERPAAAVAALDQSAPMSGSGGTRPRLRTDPHGAGRISTEMER